VKIEVYCLLLPLNQSPRQILKTYRHQGEDYLYPENFYLHLKASYHTWGQQAAAAIPSTKYLLH